uniref:Uncharacterized protein n=1 Tax=Rhizophora mucronata TaxID=61149 RepID=A0A2P2R0B9_RHIMU
MQRNVKEQLDTAWPVVALFSYPQQGPISLRRIGGIWLIKQILNVN